MGSANITNGFDPELTSRFVSDIERLEDEMLSKKGEYMAWCQRQRELINGHIDRAKDAGIPKRPFKAALKLRKMERKHQATRDEMEEADLETVDMIRAALGDLADTPLGQAAAPAKRDTTAIDSLALGDASVNQAEENAKKLRSGIKAVK